MSGLWLLDRKTWQPMDYFFLGPYGGVHDIRLLNVRDEAHHGHVFAGTTALLALDRGKLLAEERIEVSRRARIARETWKPFELVFGTPEVDNGVLKASEDLCLMINPSPEATEIGIRYELNKSSIDAHVSVVLYRGAGSDTHMNALLIQRRSETEASLSLWLHDGNRWAAENAQPILGLPLRGRIQLTGKMRRCNSRSMVG